ncbi:MAG: hypothetical protein QOI62_2575 [Solirubrobacteraceae bacterium]|jgi:hypothetical protein|nr:hypothetical protein [Solirubrobacteraceae bacterium]MEA2394556.1 hypothetical protein [Solirubrobacteraceae bacterium]
MTPAAIDWGKLLELIWAGALAGLAVAIAFAVMILGATRATDARRADRGGVAMGFAALAVLAGLLFAGGVVFGISVIVSK